MRLYFPWGPFFAFSSFFFSCISFVGFRVFGISVFDLFSLLSIPESDFRLGVAFFVEEGLLRCFFCLLCFFTPLNDFMRPLCVCGISISLILFSGSNFRVGISFFRVAFCSISSSFWTLQCLIHYIVKITC